MTISASQFIWHNGEMKPWADATTHVLAHSLHYGSSVFEGARAYETHRGACGFRLSDHTRRLFESAKIYRMAIPYTPEEINEACRRVVVENDLKSAYIRPIVYYGYGTISVLPSADTPIEVAVAAMEWGTYLGAEGLEKGVDVCVSSWNRVAPNTIPAGAKAGGNYLSGMLISGEAQRHGYAEGIGLSPAGTLSEGAGENLFIVKNNVIYTTPVAASILQGITRDSLITLARSLGYEVVQQDLPREMLYCADEVFFTGTAVEVTPVRSVDGIEVGQGSRGPVTETLQNAFFGLFDGSTRDEWGWLEPLEESHAAAIAV